MFEHLAGEFVHAGGCSRTCGADDFVADRIDGADVVNQAVGEIDGQFFAFVEHIDEAFVCGIAAGEDFAVQQQYVAGFPAGDFFFGQFVDIDAFAVVGAVSQIGPVFDARRGQFDRT